MPTSYPIIPDWVNNPCPKREQSTLELYVISAIPTWQITAQNMLTFQLQVNIKGHCLCLFHSCFNGADLPTTILQLYYKRLSWALGSVSGIFYRLPPTCLHGLILLFPESSIAWISISAELRKQTLGHRPHLSKFLGLFLPQLLHLWNGSIHYINLLQL